MFTQKNIRKHWRGSHYFQGPILEEKPLDLTLETASTMHSSREESCQPSPTAPLDARPATQPALHVQPPNLPAAPVGPMLGPDGLPLPNLLAGRGMMEMMGEALKEVNVLGLRSLTGKKRFGG